MMICRIFVVLWSGLVISTVGVKGVEVTFTFQPAQSSLTLNGFILSPINTFNQQGPGALTTSYSGSIQVEYSPAELTFLSSGTANAANSGTWSPASGGAIASFAPANYGATTLVTLTTVNFAGRNFQIGLTSGSGIPVSGGGFDSSQITLTVVAGQVDYATSSFLIPPATINLVGSSTPNGSPGGTITVNAQNVATLTVPINLNVPFDVDTSDLNPNDSAFTLTGNLVATAILPDAFTLWVDGFGLTGPDAAFDADPNNDGVSNGVAFITGGSPIADSTDKLPVFETVTESSTDYLQVTYRRTDESAFLNPFVESGTDLSGWTTAVDGVNGVNITTTDDGFGAGVDQVVVQIPMGGLSMLFARFGASAPVIP